MRVSAEVSREHPRSDKSTCFRYRKSTGDSIRSINMGSIHSIESSANYTNAAAAASSSSTNFTAASAAAVAASARASGCARASQRATAYLEMLATGPLPPPVGTGTIAMSAKSSDYKEPNTMEEEEKPLPQYLVPPVNLQNRSSLGKCLKSFLKLLSGETNAEEKIIKKRGKGSAKNLDQMRPRSLPVWECRDWSSSMPRSYSPSRTFQSRSFTPTSNLSARYTMHKQPPFDAVNKEEENTKRYRRSPPWFGTRDRKPSGRVKINCPEPSARNRQSESPNRAQRDRPRTAPQTNLITQRTRLSIPRLHTATNTATRNAPRTAAAATLSKRGSRVQSHVTDRRTTAGATTVHQDASPQVVEVSGRNSSKVVKKPAISLGQAPKPSGRTSPVREQQLRVGRMPTKTSSPRTTKLSTNICRYVVPTPSKPKRVKYTTFSGK